jgi:hypothetical protein
MFSTSTIWNRFFKTTYRRISFEDVQFSISRGDEFLLINTMPLSEQTCLIKGTIAIDREESIINNYIEQYDYLKHIIVYGKNAADDSVEKKYQQLVAFGFSNIYLYNGGMFEWLLLQDIYGAEEFPTTIKERDILKYKPLKTFGIMRLQNNIFL